MAIPKVVQRQLEQAESELAQSMQQPDPNVVSDLSQLAQQPAAPAASPAPAAPPPDNTPPPPPPAPTVDWEQKFRTAQGMLNTELSAAKARERTLESQLNTMREQLDVLMKAKRDEPPPPAPKASADPKDVENFGADMIEMVQRYALHTQQQLAAEMRAALAKFDERLKGIEANVGAVSTRTEATLEQTFYATLAKLVPDWKTINVSDEFIAWLDEVDEVYGLPRRAALTNAHQRLDAERVAAVFKKFSSTRPAKPSAALESQIAPNGGGSAPAPKAAPAKRIISQKVIEQFYLDQARGRFKGREKEMQAMEAEINLAAAEGRIV